MDRIEDEAYRLIHPSFSGVKLVILWYQVITSHRIAHVPLAGDLVIPYMAPHLLPRPGGVGHCKVYS